MGDIQVIGCAMNTTVIDGRQIWLTANNDLPTL